MDLFNLQQGLVCKECADRFRHYGENRRRSAGGVRATTHSFKCDSLKEHVFKRTKKNGIAQTQRVRVAVSFSDLNCLSETLRPLSLAEGSFSFYFF
jgi:hypothetical protein